MPLEDLSPGLAALVAITAADPHARWIVEEMDALGRRAAQQGVKPETFIAVAASTIGYSVGHGVRQRGPLATHKALEEEILLTESIFEDCAQDAFRGR